MALLEIPGLASDDQDTLDELLNQLEARMPRNKLRADYYDAKYTLRNLNISIPPRFSTFESVLGWPAKAVDSLSRRCNLDGFVIPDQSVQDLGISELWDANNMDIEASMAHDSALIHSCAFICTTIGDETAGEPPVLITVRDATSATGLWDNRKRALKAALSIVDRSDGVPTQMVMYLPDRVITMTRDAVGYPWSIDQRNHNLGRVPVEPLVYRPRLAKPFGSSRISRPVMSLTDSALRTVVRSEIGAEFYTTPQRWALNFPQEAFADSGWQAIMGRIWTIEPPSLDDNIDPAFKPEVGQFPQATMQPHTDQLRQFATLFAGETSIPVSSLGIIQDNPSSAEALYASKEELVIEAEHADRVFGVGWCRAMRNAFMLANGLSEVPAELLKLRAKWRDPATPSKAAAADAMAKQIAVLPWLAESEVALEQFGYDRTDIERLVADKRRSTVTSLLNRLPAQPQTAPVAQPDQTVTGGGLGG